MYRLGDKASYPAQARRGDKGEFFRFSKSLSRSLGVLGLRHEDLMQLLCVELPPLLSLLVQFLNFIHFFLEGAFDNPPWAAVVFMQHQG
eukprot:1352490-Amorphochlora_amoeboformis.AAC.1